MTLIILKKNGENMIPTFLESTVRHKCKEMMMMTMWTCCFDGGKHGILWEYLKMKQSMGWGDQDSFPEKLILKPNLK